MSSKLKPVFGMPKSIQRATRSILLFCLASATLALSAPAHSFVFSRTDTNEFRWVEPPGNIWINSSCAESLGGATEYGNWGDLNSIAPQSDSIANPCNGVPVTPAPTNQNGFVFSRSDTNEFRWVVGAQNVWIDSNCAASLGGASLFGNWGDLNNVAPLFDSLENPCNNIVVTPPTTPTPPVQNGFVFSRTDSNEFRWVVGSQNVWIDGGCAATLGGATVFGNWGDLNNVAPLFDSLDNPCTSIPPVEQPQPTNSNGFVFSRTDTNEFRWVVGTNNVWIDASCANSLGGPTQFGNWQDLYNASPNFDSIASPICELVDPPVSYPALSGGDYLYYLNLSAGETQTYSLSNLEWLELIVLNGDVDLSVYRNSDLTDLICHANRGTTSTDACHYIMEDCFYQDYQCFAQITGYASNTDFHIASGSAPQELPVLHGGDERSDFLYTSETRLFSITQATTVSVNPIFGDADLEVFESGIDGIQVCSSSSSGTTPDVCNLPDYFGEYQIRVRGYTDTEYRIRAD